MIQMGNGIVFVIPLDKGVGHHCGSEQETACHLHRFGRYVGGAFLRSYFEQAQDALFLPQDVEEMDILLNAFLLHKAIYELVYELNSRPDWVATPLRGIRSVLDIKGKASLIVEMQKAYPSGLPSP